MPYQHPESRPSAGPDRRTWPGVVFVSLGFALIAAAVAAWASAPRPALTPDSTFYLNAAENILRGRGLSLTLTSTDRSASSLPLTAWPPLYPILIAAARGLAHDPLSAARLVQILAAGLTALPIGWLAYRIAGRAFVPVVLAFYCLMRSQALIASFVWSEAVFEGWTYLALALLLEGLRADAGGAGGGGGRRARGALLASAGACAALAMQTRYLGFAVIASGLVVIILHAEEDHSGRRTSRDLALFGAPAILPNLAWLARNRILTGYLFGEDRGRAPFDPQSIAVEAVRSFWTDVVMPPAAVSGPWSIVAGGAGILCFAILAWVAMSQLGKRTTGEAAFAARTASGVATLAIIYSLALVGLSLWIRYDPITTRFLSPVYPALLLLSAFLLKPAFGNDPARDPAAGRGERIRRAVLVAAASVLLILQTVATMRYVRGPFEARADTNPYWRSIVFGDPRWAEDPAIANMRRIVPEDGLVLSNIADVVAIWTDRSAKPIPRVDDPRGPEILSGFPGAYVLIHPRYRRPWMGIDDLERMVREGRCKDVGPCGDASLYRVSE